MYSTTLDIDIIISHNIEKIITEYFLLFVAASQPDL